MRMDAGLDTGPIAMREVVPILPDETAGDLTARLATIAAKLSVSALRLLEAGRLEFREQPAVGVCYARKIEKSEAEIDWTQDAEKVRNQIHGLSPAPGAFSKAPHWKSRGKHQILACRGNRRERTAWNTPFRRHEGRVRDRRDTSSSGATIGKDCHERPRIDAGREARSGHCLQAGPCSFIRSRSMSLSSSLLPSAARKIWLAERNPERRNAPPWAAREHQAREV